MNCHPTYCGMLVTIEDDRVVKITGDPENPDSRGFLCLRGRAVVELADSPNRLLEPLMRPHRHAPLEPATWDQALDRIADTIKGQPLHRTAVWPGHGVFVSGLGGQLSERFAAIAGAQYWSPAIVCWGLGGLGYWLTGVTEVSTASDLAEHAEVIFLWGANLASQPTTGPHLTAARRRGARMIVIDVRRTEACAQADESYVVRPGSDAHLALAMMHVIVREGLHDQPFIDRHTIGFEELRRHLELFTPERAAIATGLAGEQIEHLARTYAASRRAMILAGGSSMYKTANAWHAARAIACLPALTGNLGRPGAGMGPRHAAQSHGAGFKSIVPPTRLPAAHQVPSEMSSILAAIEDGRVRNLLLLGTNMLSSFADTDRLRRALAGLDLVVSFDLFMQETAALADLVLPGTSWLEETGYKATNTHLYLMDRAIERRGQARSLADLLRGLADRLELPEFFPWASLDGVLDEVFDAPASAGANVESLRETDGRARLKVGPVGHPDLSFPTPSGKVEFVSQRARELGLPDLPVAADLADDGLTFVQGRTIAHFHGFYDHGRALPGLARADSGPAAWINPKDADARGIADGEAVRLHNHRGEMRAAARVTDEVPAGTVWMHDGWAGLNSLTSSERVVPDAAALAFPQGGSAAYSATVEVQRLRVSPELAPRKPRRRRETPSRSG